MSVPLVHGVRRIGTLALVVIAVAWSTGDATARVTSEMRERAVATLIQGTKSGDFTTRAMAVAGLGKAPRKEALPVVKEALEDPQWQVRRATIQALLTLRDKTWQTAIVDAMKSERLGPREEVLPLLAPLGHAQALGVVRKALSDKTFKRPERYAHAFRDEGGPMMVAVYDLALRSGSEEVRNAFQHELARLPLPDALPLYKKVLARQSAAVQSKVVDRILADPTLQNVGFLASLLRSKDASVALRAAAALAYRGSAKGKKVLLAAATGSDEAARLLALEALFPIAGRDLEGLAKDIVNHKKSPAAALRAAYAIYAKVGTKDLAPHLAKRLRSTNLERRAAAVGVLGKVLGRKALVQLHPLLRDGSVEVRRQAARAISGLAKPESIQALREALFAEQDVETRRELVRALSGIGTPETVPVIQQYIYDTDEATRMEAVKALQSVRHGSTTDLLTLKLQDRAQKIRRRALTALMDLGPERHVTAFEKALGWLTPEDLASMVAEHGARMVPHINHALRSDRESFRDAALTAVASLPKAERASIYARLALGGDRTSLRVAGIRGVVEVEARKRALEILTSLTGERDMLVRVASIEALGALRAKGVDELLHQLTNDPDERVRVAASSALLRL